MSATLSSFLTPYILSIFFDAAAFSNIEVFCKTDPLVTIASSFSTEGVVGEVFVVDGVGVQLDCVDVLVIEMESVSVIFRMLLSSEEPPSPILPRTSLVISFADVLSKSSSLLVGVDISIEAKVEQVDVAVGGPVGVAAAES